MHHLSNNSQQALGSLYQKLLSVICSNVYHQLNSTTQLNSIENGSQKAKRNSADNRKQTKNNNNKQNETQFTNKVRQSPLRLLAKKCYIKWSDILLLQSHHHITIKISNSTQSFNWLLLQPSYVGNIHTRILYSKRGLDLSPSSNT